MSVRARGSLYGAKLSRRRLLPSGPAAAVATALPAPLVDDVVAASEQRLSRESEAQASQTRWGRLEDKRMRAHRWKQLTERQRCNLPAAQDLCDIDERLDVLPAERDALLTRLPSPQASNRTGPPAKLAVAATVVSSDYSVRSGSSAHLAFRYRLRRTSLHRHCQTDPGPTAGVRIQEHDAIVFQARLNAGKCPCLHPALAGFKAQDRGFRDARLLRQLAHADAQPRTGHANLSRKHHMSDFLQVFDDFR